MDNQYVEQRLKKDVEEITPDVIDGAIEKCSGAVQSEKIKKRRPKVWQMCAAAAAVLVLVIGGAFFINNLNAVDSVIGLDVNPSLEISINKNEKVLSVNAVNEDAKGILDGMDLAGTDLKVAVNALIGSMYTNGYISENQNSVLVSVKSGSQERSELLKQELLSYIENALQGTQVDGAVVSLNVDSSDTLNQLAQDLGVSEGKATLIEAILAADPSQNAEELAKLSINDLNILAQSKQIASVDVSGSASTGEYISIEKAQQLINEKLPGCTIAEFELDWENGRMVYEGEAYLNGAEYDFEVDALTGEIVKWKQDGYGNPDGGSSVVNPSEEYLSQEEAQSNILGKLPSGAVISSIKLDTDDGRAVYEADAYAGSTIYDIEIDAVTGETVKWETKTQSGGQTSGEIMTEAQARELILSKLPSGAVINKIKLDYDDGRQVYEAEAYADSVEYDIEINAVSGETVKWETEKVNSGQSGNYISADRAREIILERFPNGNIIEFDSDIDDGKYEGEIIHENTKYDFEISASSGEITKLKNEGTVQQANITREQAISIVNDRLPGCTIVEMEFDNDDGRAVYEGEARLDRVEYEFTIDAATGSIIEWEADD